MLASCLQAHPAARAVCSGAGRGMGLHVAALAPREILQLPGDGAKGIADGDIDILILGTVRHQFRTGHGEVAMDTIELALMLVPLRRLDHHTAAEHLVVETA